MTLKSKYKPRLRILYSPTLLFVFIAFFSHNCANTGTKSTLDNKHKSEVVSKSLNFEYFTDVKTEGDKIHFNLKLKRIKDKPEFFSTSEYLRLEIFDENKNLVYASNKGINYLQAIGKVYPDSLNGEYIYEISWNFKNNNGIKVQNGNYSAILTLLSQPINYIEKFIITLP